MSRAWPRPGWAVSWAREGGRVVARDEDGAARTSASSSPKRTRRSAWATSLAYSESGRSPKAARTFVVELTPPAETTVWFGGSWAAMASAWTPSTAATALARASSVAWSCWRRSRSRTKIGQRPRRCRPPRRRRSRTRATGGPGRFEAMAGRSGRIACGGAAPAPAPVRVDRRRACPTVRSWPSRGSARPVAPGSSWCTSALREGVARAPHRQDEPRAGRVVLELLAQVADVDVDRLLVLVERLVVADQLEQLAPRVDAARAGWPGGAGSRTRWRSGRCAARRAGRGAARGRSAGRRGGSPARRRRRRGRRRRAAAAP